MNPKANEPKILGIKIPKFIVFIPSLTNKFPIKYLASVPKAPAIVM